MLGLPISRVARVGDEDNEVTATIVHAILEAQKAAAAATRAAREARAQRRRAVLAARCGGATLHEIADVLGVSFQRVSQIIHSENPKQAA